MWVRFMWNPVHIYISEMKIEIETHERKGFIERLAYINAPPGAKTANIHIHTE